MAIGQTFAPMGDEDELRRRGRGGAGGPGGVQEAVRMLSLRLPRVLGAQSPVPAPLLQSPGGAALPPGAGPNPAVAALLMQLFGSGQGMPPFAGGASMPSPMGGMAPTNPNPKPKLNIIQPPVDVDPDPRYPRPENRPRHDRLPSPTEEDPRGSYRTGGGGPRRY